MDTNHRPRPRRAARWTPLEVLLILVSAMLIVFPLFAEATRWISPPPVPAANRQQGDIQRVTASPTPDDGTPTDVALPTDVGQPTALPTDVGQPTALPTDVGQPTALPTDVGQPTALPTDVGQPTALPTDVGQPTAIPTPVMGAKLLTVSKSVAVSSAAPGEEFTYLISAFTSGEAAESVQVSDQLDPKLEVVSATTNAGSCTTAQAVVCTLNVTNAGVLITLNVRARVDAAGTRIANTAVGIITTGGNKDVTDSSDTVYVNIEGTPVNATAAPTSVGATATSGPNPPTAIPTTGPNPPATSGPNPPPPGPNPAPATAVPNPPSGGSNPPPEQQPIPIEPPVGPPPPDAVVVSPATPGAGGNPPAVTTRPAQPRPTVRPPAQATLVAPAASTATSESQTQPNAPTSTLTVPTPDTGLYLRMASDWGSAYPDQTVNYVIAVRNTRAAGAADYANLRITSDVPANLEVVSATSDRGGDPVVSGNAVSFKLATLAPGQGVEIVIVTKVRANIAAGTTIVTQAILTADGLTTQNYSNAVALLVVGAPVQQATATAASSASVVPTFVANATPVGATSAPSSITNALTPSVTSVASPTFVATVIASAPTSGGDGSSAETPAPLPNTSTGIPLIGLALLGTTMFVRTVRLRRSQMRV